MRCWSSSHGFGLATLAALSLWPGTVQAADDWPMPLYAGVMVAAEGEPDPAVVARSLNEAISLLVGSGRYRVRGQDELAERLGGPPGELALRCGEDPGCWQTVTFRAGVDVIVLLELATPGDGSVPVTRASIWGPEGPLVAPVVVPLPREGGAPLEWMAQGLLQPGELSLKIIEGGLLSVDGAAWPPQGGVRSLPPGRHQIRAQFGDEVQVQVVPVLSGHVTARHLAPAMAPGDVGRTHRRWGLVAMPALAVGGAVALVVQRDWPGDAAR